MKSKSDILVIKNKTDISFEYVDCFLNLYDGGDYYEVDFKPSGPIAGDPISPTNTL